jgi:hypothetical protein
MIFLESLEESKMKAKKKFVDFILKNACLVFSTTYHPRHCFTLLRCLTMCNDSACSLAETSHLFHSQTETTKQTTLHNMLDSDGSVHLETNGQTFIDLQLRLWAEASCELSSHEGELDSLTRDSTFSNRNLSKIKKYFLVRFVDFK